MKRLLAQHTKWDGWDLTQRVLAAILLIALSPLLVIVALLVKLTSSGPVFFSQERPGRNRRPFHIYKFRTMTVGSERDESLQLGVTCGEARVTKVGRVLRNLKIDELPQLWNVLRGDMGFVGPRAIGPALDRMLSTQISQFDRRYDVKPGLTSLAQICIHDNQRNVVHDWLLRSEAELHYLRYRSRGYDLIVIALTGLFLLRRLTRILRRDETGTPVEARVARRECIRKT